MKISRELHTKLTDIATNEPWQASSRLKDILKTLEIEEKTPKRTDPQARALFLWFSMIEHEAQNAGITWNHVVGKTHQLKITKEGLHVMAKQLSEALWGIKSTTQLKKTGHIDDLIDHFTDLFAKVGLTLPPFPCDELRQREEQAMGMAWKTGQKADIEYPESTEDVLL